MERFDLNGKWKITSKTYDVEGEMPGSVYTALLANGLMADPFYRDNEAKALAIMDEEFIFTKEFNYVKTSNHIQLVCEGIDTLCDLYINGKTYKLVNATTEISPYVPVIITFKVIGGDEYVKEQYYI